MGEDSSTITSGETSAADPLIDARLMRAISAGDRAALGTLYDRYAARLLGLLMRMLGTRADAEETLAEIFFEVWDKVDRYDADRACVATYLLTLARSRGIDKQRKRLARPDMDPARSRSVEPADIDQSQPAAPSPLSGVLFEEQAVIVRSAMERLELPQRRAIELSYFEGLSHSEIASRLERPLGTIKTWIRQGLGHLRNSLASYSDMPE